MRKKIDLNDESVQLECFIVSVCIAVTIIISLGILFAPYERNYVLTIDGIDYYCSDFVVKDDFVEIHTTCVSDMIANHTKYCSYYIVRIMNGYSVECHKKTHFNDWFGGYDGSLH